MTGREEAVRTFLEFGASAGVYDDTGTSCLTHMISNMPDVASSALEQFHRVDKASKTVYYYLSYMETYKWEEMRMKSERGSRMLTRREPLEVCFICFVFIMINVDFNSSPSYHSYRNVSIFRAYY